MPEVAALITGLILERPLCLPCLATKSALTVTVVERTIATIGTVMRFYRGPERCRACGVTTNAVWVERSGI